MTITAADIKLLASERLNDDADGGGFMTGTVVADGVENNLFPDVSSLDRAQGAMDFRKVFAAVLTDTQDVYYGAHLVLDMVPADPAVSAVMRASTGADEDRAACVGTIAALGSAGVYYGTKPLTVAGAVADRTVKVSGLTLPLIPRSVSGSATSGLVGASANTVEGAFPVGATVSKTVSASANYSTGSNMSASVNFEIDPQLQGGQRALAGSFSATVNGYFDSAGTVHSPSSPATVTANSATGQLQVTPAPAAVNPLSVGNSLALSGIALATQYRTGLLAYGDAVKVEIVGTYQPALLVKVPREELRLEITAANQNYVYNFALPADTLPGSETITYQYSASPALTLNTNSGGAVPGNLVGTSNFFGGSTVASATINRFSGAVQLLLSGGYPVIGSFIVISYGRKSACAELLSSALSGSGNFDSSGHLTVTLPTGKQLGAFSFYIGTVGYSGRDGTVSSGPTGNSIVGSYDKATGVISLAVSTGAVTSWRGVSVNPDIGVQSLIAPIAKSLAIEGLTLSGTTTAGAAFTATSDATGSFSTALVTGTYDATSGVLDLAFSAAVKAGTITYTALQNVYALAGIAITGFATSAFDSSGAVTVFRKTDIVVVYNTQTVAAAT